MSDDLHSAALDFFSRPADQDPPAAPPAAAPDDNTDLEQAAQQFFATPSLAPDRSSWLRRTATAVRDSLSPLIGPSESQQLREGVPTTDADGNVTGSQYKPLGDQIERRGAAAILRAPTRQIVPQFRATVADIGSAMGGDASAPNLTALSRQAPQDEDYGKLGTTPYDAAQGKETGVTGMLDRVATQMLPDIAQRLVFARGIARGIEGFNPALIAEDSSVEGAAAEAAKTPLARLASKISPRSDIDPVAHAVANGIAFGQKDDGSIDPYRGAVMTVLPVVGEMGAKAVAKWISSPVDIPAPNPTSLGVAGPIYRAIQGEPRIKSELVAKALEEIVGRGGAQTALQTVSDLPQIMELPKEKRAQAIEQSVGYGMAFSLLSIPGVIDARVPSTARLQILGRVLGKMSADYAVRPASTYETTIEKGILNAPIDPIGQPAGVPPEPPGTVEVGKTAGETKPGDSLPGAAWQPPAPIPTGETTPELAPQVGGEVGLTPNPNNPEWVNQEMIDRGLDPHRPLNDVDRTNPSVVDAVKMDPTLSDEEKRNVLATGSPITPPAEAKRQEARAGTDVAPSEAQKEAGNYAKGKISWNGLTIAIENPKGSQRTGTDAEGKPWQVTMPADYGHIHGHEGKDGDLVDIYLGPNLASPHVFVIDQRRDDTGAHDEHKTMVGFDSGEDAIQAYNAGFSDNRGAARLGAMIQMTVPEFKEWLENGDKSKPITDYAQEKLDAHKASLAKPTLEKDQHYLFHSKAGDVAATPNGNLFIFGHYDRRKDAYDTAARLNTVRPDIAKVTPWLKKAGAKGKSQWTVTIANVPQSLADNLHAIVTAQKEPETPLETAPPEEQVKADEGGESKLDERSGGAEAANVEPPPGEPRAGGPVSGGQLGGEQSEAGSSVGGEPGTSAIGEAGGAGGVRSGGESEEGGQRTPEPGGDLRPLRGPDAQTPEQRSRSQQSNYVITPADAIGRGGLKTKFADNVAAIKLLREIESAKRPATTAEQSILARYVGWGGLKAVFSEGSKQWLREAAELKELLTPEEYAAARRSVLDAHYTSPTVIGGVYAAMKRFGFPGGRMVEGGVGLGHFIGLMPASMRGRSSYVGVEKDPLTARICALLYPLASIHNAGFEEVDLSRGFFDGSVGNPPFGQQSLFDKNFKEESKRNIHTFFIGKTLELLRPGGVAAFVVSHHLLDNLDPSSREFLVGKANFIGAIRLPNTAFKENANTEVTTDIVFFQKLPEGMKSSDLEWTKTGTVTDPETSKSIKINKWLADHPEMMLGQMTLGGKLYAGGEQATLEPRAGSDLKTDLGEAVKRLPSDIYQAVEHRTEERLTTAEQIFGDDIPQTAKVGTFFLVGNKVFRRDTDVNSRAVATRAALGATEERVKGIVLVRDVLKALVQEELGAGDPIKMAGLRTSLNRAYDAFVKKFGFLNSSTNRRTFYDDPESAKVLGLEKDYDAGVGEASAKKKGVELRAPEAKKADIFTKRVNSPYREVTHAGTAKEALIVSMNQRGVASLDYMASLSGKTPEALREELKGLLFENPTGGFEESTQYLSGNVRSKLAEAEAAAAKDPRFEANVEALRKAQPAPIAPTDIMVPIGAPWLPAAVIGDFAEELTGVRPRTVLFLSANGGWAFNHSGGGMASTREWGTSRLDFGEIFKLALNGQPVVVNDIDADGKKYVNQEETALAQAQLDKIKRKWQDWIWSDQGRRESLAKIYNDTFNAYVDPHYDGSHLKLPGKSDVISLRQHQLNVIWRTVTDPKVLYDHEVGAGKTFAGVASFMEMRRLGRVRKPLFVVPNHLTNQWRDAFVTLYPNSNILAATSADFEKDRREKFFGKIMSGDYDAIIVAHSSFKRLGVSPETESEVLREMLSELAKTIEDVDRAEGGGKQKNRTRLMSQLERQKEKIEARLALLADKVGDKDRGTTFEETGIDGLFVDESQEFKNLFYTTQMRNVAGLGVQKGSARAFDLYVKTRYLRKQFGGKAPLVFATGTPVSNSLVEMFTVQRYLQPEKLEEMNLKTLDAWSRVFGDISSDYEVDPTGTGYRISTRFRNFQNIGDLASIYRTTADVVTMSDLKAQAESEGKRFPVPKVKGGKPTAMVVERTDDQARYFGLPDKDGNYLPGTILYRIEHMPKDPSEDNMLKVTNDARKCGLDMRLIRPDATDDPNSKVNIAVQNILRIHRQKEKDKGTQLVFCDLSVPASARGKASKKAQEIAERKAREEEANAGKEVEEDEGEDAPSIDDLLADQSKFSVYDDVRSKLIKGGVPANQIAFIHDYHTPDQKKKLFDAVNRGDIRILLGSTAKMGAGTNVQKRLVALHHLDAPWRPSDLIQREGRILRQGNELYERDPEGFEVEIPRYATRMTYDTRMWQLIEHKAAGIEGFRRADRSLRRMEDVGGQAANAAEMKAAASGNPLILRELELRTNVTRLENIYRAWQTQRHSVESSMVFYRSHESRYEAARKVLEAAIKTRDANTPAEGKFEFMPARGKAVENPKEAAQLFADTAKKLQIGEEVWGTYRGFKMTMRPFVQKYSSVNEKGEIVTHKGVGIDVVSQMTPESSMEKVTSFDHDEKIHAGGLFQRLDNWMGWFGKTLEAAKITRDREAASMAEREAEIKKPFADKAALDRAREEYAAVQMQLRASATKSKDTKASLGEEIASPLSADHAAQVVKRLTRNLPNAPRIQIVNDGNLMVGGKLAAGLTKGNQVTINLAAIASEEHLAAVLAEEVIGHFGVEAALGDARFVSEVDQLGDAVSDETLQPIADAYGLNLGEAGDRREAVIEYLAKQSKFGEAPKEPGLFRRLWEAIKAAFRRLFGRQASEDRIRDILQKAHDFLAGKAKAAGSGPAAARASAAPEGVPHQVMGKRTTVGSRETSGPEDVKDQVSLTGTLLRRAGIPATLTSEVDPRRPGTENAAAHVSQLWRFQDTGADMTAAGEKLVELVHHEIANLKTPGQHGGRLANIISSISMNFRRGNMEMFPPAIRDTLYGMVRDEASFHAMAMGALAHHSVDIEEIGFNPDLALRRVWSDAFGGEDIRTLVGKIAARYREILTPEEVDAALKDAPGSQDVIARIQAAANRDTHGRVYWAVQQMFKPKRKPTERQMESSARVREAIDQIVANAKALGLREPPQPGKVKLTPEERLALMTKPETAGDIQRAIEGAVEEAENNAGNTAWRKSVASDPEKAQEVENRIAAGDRPDPKFIEDGLDLKEYAHWRVIRDGLLDYSPTTVKLARDVIQGRFKGANFKTPTPPRAENRIDLAILARSPDEAVERVFAQQLADIEAVMDVEGASDAAKQRVLEIMRDDMVSQIDRIRGKIRDAMLADKTPTASKTPEQRLAELVNAKLFSDPRMDTPFVQRVAAKGVLQALLPKMGDLIKTVMATPYSRQSDFEHGFVQAAVKKFGTSPAEAAGLWKVFQSAIGTKMRDARARAAKTVLESLTPKERLVVKKRSLQDIITRNANAGNFDDGDILRQIAAKHGWKPPSDEQVTHLKQLAGRSQELNELGTQQRLRIEINPDLTEAEKAAELRAQTQKKQAVLRAERAQIIKRMAAAWAEMTRPIGFRGFLGMGRPPGNQPSPAENLSRALMEQGTLNSLMTAGYTTFRLITHLTTQEWVQTMVQTVGRAWTTWENDRTASRDANLMADMATSVHDNLRALIASVAPAVRAARVELQGRGEGRNSEQAMEGVHALERLAAKAEALMKTGSPVDKAKAMALYFVSLPRLMTNYISAVDHIQGVPFETQELLNQTEIAMRESGAGRPQIELFKNELLQTIRTAQRTAILEAEQLFAQAGVTPTKTELAAAADRLAVRNAYLKVQSASMPADEFEARTEGMRKALAWQITPEHGIGGALAKISGTARQMAARQGLPLLPLMLSNAMGQSVNYVLLTTPGYKAATVPLTRGSGPSPWEPDSRGQKERMAMFVIVGSIAAPIMAMILAGAAKWVTSWPKSKAARDRFAAEGHKINTVEIQVPGGGFIPISTTVGPFAVLRPWIAAAQAVRDVADKHQSAQEKENKVAESKGLTPQKLDGPGLPEVMASMVRNEFKAIVGSSVLQGAVASIEEKGDLVTAKGLAAAASSLVPGLKAYQEISRMAGVSLDPRLASVWDYMVPLPSSGARELNLLGDPVKTPDDVQRIVQSITSGSFPGVVNPTSDADARAYQTMAASGFTPSAINAGKGYAINGDYRPLNETELAAYAAQRGANLKAAVAALPEGASKSDVASAFHQADGEALASVGAEQAAPAQAATHQAQGSTARHATAQVRNRGFGGRSSGLRSPRVGSGMARVGRLGGLRAPRGQHLRSTRFATGLRSKSHHRSLRI